MVEKKIKDSFTHAKLTREEKERIYERIQIEAASSPETIPNISKRGRKSEMRSGVKRIAVACVAVALAGSVTVGAYAGYKWLTPSKIVSEVEETDALAKEFGKSASEIQIQEAGGYRVANLGVVSGDNIGHEVTQDNKVITDRTYIAVAIERKNKVPITLDDKEFYVSPLMQYIRHPWAYDCYSQGSDANMFVKDGVLYILFATSNIEKFAANKVYLAVQSGTSYNTEAYNYDEQTGELSRNPEFKELNVLFELQLDKSKADPKAAQEIIDKVNEETQEDDEDQEAPIETQPQDDGRAVTGLVSSVKDKKNGLELKVLDGTEFTGCGGDLDIADAYYAIYPEVVGKGINTITYSLSEGAFYSKEEATMEEARNPKYPITTRKEYIGQKMFGDQNKDNWILKQADSSYTVKYEEQNTVGNVYDIGVKTKYIRNENETIAINAMYTALAEELHKRTVDVAIKYKDGHTVNKKLVFTVDKDARRPYRANMEWK